MTSSQVVGDVARDDKHNVSPHDALHKLSVREAATFLRVSKSFLDKHRLDGCGPEFLKLGRRVVYDLRDLESWALSTKRRCTSSAA